MKNEVKDDEPSRNPALPLDSTILDNPNTRYNFYSKIDKGNTPESCWIWKAGVNKKGYGRIIISRKVGLSHRISYAVNKGGVPDGICVLHSCDNPRCCNPAHLWLGTKTDNHRDMVDKGRDRKAIGDKCGSRTHPECRPKGDSHHSRINPDNMCHGIDHPNAVLDDEKVRQIRAQCESGLGFAALARIYGVHEGTISNAFKRKTWKHVK